MAKSKKPRRRYNPARQVERALERVARSCYLFRWESKGSGTEFAFSSGAHYSDEQTVAALEHIMSRCVPWIVMVHACFIAGDDYYERGDLWITEPVMLNGQADKIHAQITAAVAEQRGAGNPRHYYDTVVVMRPLSDRALALADDDEWLKAQAAYRADTVTRQALIEKLEAQENAA